jgi:hypothetical protein
MSGRAFLRDTESTSDEVVPVNDPYKPSKNPAAVRRSITGPEDCKRVWSPTHRFAEFPGATPPWERHPLVPA